MTEELEEILYKENLVIDAYVYKGEPFDYLDLLLTNYTSKCISYTKVLNYSLDVYNYYQKNNILHEGVQKALHQTARKYITEAYQRMEQEDAGELE